LTQFQFVNRTAPADPETQVSTELSQQFSNRVIRQDMWSQVHNHFLMLDQKAVLKVVKWVRGQSDAALWEDVTVEQMIQILMFGAIFKMPTLEQIAVAFLDLTFFTAGYCPSDAFMSWMWSIKPYSPHVRQYLLQVCYYHLVHRGRSTDHFES
jgi:hypothetical protein